MNSVSPYNLLIRSASYQALHMAILTGKLNIEAGFRFELPVKPVVITRIWVYMIDLLNKVAKVGIETGHCITGDSHVKRLDSLVHETNVQNKA